MEYNDEDMQYGGMIVTEIIDNIFEKLSSSVGGKKSGKKGGKKTSKKTGGTIELSPILVSLIILGLRVISNSKLSSAYMKHVKKVRGGNDNMEIKFFDSMLKTGGNNGAIVPEGMLPSLISNISGLIKGGKKKSYKGGQEYAGVDFSIPTDQSFSDYQFIEKQGGKKLRKSKKVGGQASTTDSPAPTAPTTTNPAQPPPPKPAESSGDNGEDCVEDTSNTTTTTGTTGATGTGATGTGATGRRAPFRGLSPRLPAL